MFKECIYKWRQLENEKRFANLSSCEQAFKNIYRKFCRKQTQIIGIFSHV